MEQSFGNHSRDLGFAQMAITDSPIQIALHIPAQVAMDFFDLRLITGSRKALQTFRMFALKRSNTSFGNESASLKVTK